MAPIPYMNLLISVCVVQNNVDSSHILASSSSVQHGLLRFFNALTHQTPSPPSVSAIERGFHMELLQNNFQNNFFF